MLIACFSLVLVLGQVKTPRRITAVFVAAGTEGARVTIVSDSQLTESEAFRRGERFYVRIPLAEFVAAQPAFRGDGFEDVQIQKVGDSVVVSFKLEVGASARVDEGGNQIQVLFSSPTAIARNNKAVRSRVISTSVRSGSRGRDAAGPMPPDSPEIIEGADESISTDGTGTDPWRHSSRTRAKGLATTTVAGDNKAAQNALSSPTPYSYPSPGGTPYTSYPATAGSTPVASVANSPGSAATSLNRRGESPVQWASANRVVVIGASIVVVALAAFAVVMFRRRGMKTSRTKNRLDVPRVEPKPSDDFKDPAIDWSDLNEDLLFDEGFDFQEPQSETGVDQVASANVSNSAYDERWAASQSRVPPADVGAYVTRDEREREVFEL